MSDTQVLKGAYAIPLPKGWQYFTLTSLLEHIVDNRGKTPPTADAGVPLIATVNISRNQLYPTDENLRYVSTSTYETWFRSHPKPDDIIITNKGEYRGSVCLVPNPVYFCMAQDMVALRANRRVVNPHYLLAALRSDYFSSQVEAFTVSSAIPHLRKTDFDKLLVPVPPMEEQVIIGKTYVDFSKKAELNRRMNATLEATARAIFQSWFVDFDPVHAKARGEQPIGMDAEIAALFPDSFEDSELGMIPAGWRVGDIYEFAKVTYGAPFSSKQFSTDGRGYPLIRIRDLKTNQPEVFTEELHPNARLIEPGDIVVGMDGEFRAYRWQGVLSYLNQRVCTFVPNSTHLRTFIYESIVQPLAFFERAKIGTTVIHLGKADIDTFRVLVPPDAILKAFGNLTEPMIDKVVANTAEARRLAETRDALLPKLISGEVRVSEV